MDIFLHMNQKNETKRNSNDDNQAQSSSPHLVTSTRTNELVEEGCDDISFTPNQVCGFIYILTVGFLSIIVLYPTTSNLASQLTGIKLFRDCSVFTFFSQF